MCVQLFEMTLSAQINSLSAFVFVFQCDGVPSAGPDGGHLGGQDGRVL